MASRTTTAGTIGYLNLFNDDGIIVAQRCEVSDNGVTATLGKMGTGAV